MPVSIEFSRGHHLRWSGVLTPADGYFGGVSRLAHPLLFSEGEPLAPELNRYAPHPCELCATAWIVHEV